MSDQWKEAVDRTSKRVYLYSDDKSGVRWKVVGEYDVFSDERTGRYYYVHRVTKKPQWEPPSETEGTSDFDFIVSLTMV